MKKAIVLVSVLLLSGCSTRGWYDGMGMKQKNDCYKMGGTSLECEQPKESYESYKNNLNNSEITK